MLATELILRLLSRDCSQRMGGAGTLRAETLRSRSEGSRVGSSLGAVDWVARFGERGSRERSGEGVRGMQPRIWSASAVGVSFSLRDVSQAGWGRLYVLSGTGR